MYFVISGEYVDTSFVTMIQGTDETFGPFPCYDTALRVWRGVAGRNVDNCHHRAVIRGPFAKTPKALEGAQVPH